MDYNTTREKLVLPEYGRLVQDLADYAVTLENRDERQQCAEMIVRVMANFNPKSNNVPGFRHKLWDHLAMITDYKLDIDYPYPIEHHEANAKPDIVPYPMTKIRYRHYGHLLEELLKEVSEMPEGPERDELTHMAEGQMRRSMEAWNKDSLNNDKIRADLNRYTQHK